MNMNANLHNVAIAEARVQNQYVAGLSFNSPDGCYVTIFCHPNVALATSRAFNAAMAEQAALMILAGEVEL